VAATPPEGAPLQFSEGGDVEAYLEQHERRELLRFVAVGSVDDGKSTLIGRLLHDSHGIYEDQLSDVIAASKHAGSTGGELDLALLTDGLKAEREQGITIDVAYRYFSTEKRKLIIADTPGHVQYTRNMATGASTANVALILIDATRGVQQQSRRHAYIASQLGILHLAVCVNKMDLVEHDQAVFEAIKADFDSLRRKVRFEDVCYIPVSAVTGTNVVHADPEATPWYSGPTLLSYLENVSLSADRNLHSFRFPVQLVLRPDLSYRGYCGQVASGVVKKGDEVIVLPSGKRTTVAAIDTYDGELEEAFAPMSVTLRLSDEIDISRGDMIVHRSDEPVTARRIEGDIVWMSETPLDVERSYFLKHTTRTVRAQVGKVCGRLNLETLEREPSATFELNDIGRLQLTCNQPLHVDSYADNRHTGAFILIDAISNNTVAAGMIVRTLQDEQLDSSHDERSLVTAEQRRQRFGHDPIVVWFVGEPEPGQSNIAYALERKLFERGALVSVVDVEAHSDGTRSSALFADLAEQCFRLGAITVFSSGLPRGADRTELLARFPHAQRVCLSRHGGHDVMLDDTLNPAESAADAATAADEVIAALVTRQVLQDSDR